MEPGDVDAVLRLAGDDVQAGRSELGGWPWIPAGVATNKRGDGGKRRSGRRRYDAGDVTGDTCVVQYGVFSSRSRAIRATRSIAAAVGLGTPIATPSWTRSGT